MKEKQFLLENRINFKCSSPLSYGTRLTIIDNPVKSFNKWIASVFETPSRIEKIEFDKQPKIGETFVVLSEGRTDGSTFSHWAVSGDLLEAKAEEIEQQLLKTLKQNILGI